ncbi:DUF3267 domain-containing protein [Listeria booriae]|uniref:DUF3267 domain-containing protein n=1 Tax=Listeria booriae TaxID=1552123 RepID=A0A7X1BVN1_9LIST|nr:DUF3267 domain-containing protein [Listeria booriae]MBC1333100.1 DUF3267 domain-containing protein [Listeria booriae]MBC2369637.1 DUF3267 domain-containing protein [Listeria booriae]MBC2388500.1 DUF3267 domain-containing protein [Listeria booriae]
MRCLKTINVERKDEYNRVFFKSSLVSLAAMCVLFLIENLVFPNQFVMVFELPTFIGLLALYPVHKGLHILALMRYRDGVQIRVKRHFYVLPCLQVRIRRVIPKWRYIASLIFPFVLISVILIVAMLTTPIFHSPLFLILIAIHVGMCYPDFLHIKNILGTPKHTFVEDADRGFSVLVSEE